MAYTTIDKGSEYFNTVLYTGTGSATSITGVGFQPDWVWIKPRSFVDNHVLFDSVRGVQKRLISNSTATEFANAQMLTAFGSDSFSLGTDNNVNGSSNTYASWNWLAGGTAVSNTAGSITSTVSANTTSGFSIVSYTGNGTDNDTATIGHGLGVAPNFIITKCRSEAGGWISSSTSLGWNNVVSLNTTDASSAGTQAFGVTGVTPSSITFTVSANSGGNHTNINGATYIAYCFAEKKGFSKFGKYTGNGSATDGTFVYTGFKPRFIMIKGTTLASSWVMFDTVRSTINPVPITGGFLLANVSNAEAGTGDSAAYIDILSNGFKIRNNSGFDNNSGSDTYIYMAFAENTFVTSTSVPTTAR
jgi:hypothetical protein